MVMSLMGRIQTKVFLLCLVGIPWVGAVTPLLISPSFSTRPAALLTGYYTDYAALALVITAGSLWEVLYHLYIRTRQDQDWPSLLALLVGINEGAVSWLLCAHIFHLEIPRAAYAVMFGGLWALLWAIVQGPLRIINPHWRFNGGLL